MYQRPSAKAYAHISEKTGNIKVGGRAGHANTGIMMDGNVC